MLWSLTWLAPMSLLASDLPRGLAWPLALVAMAWAITDAMRYRAMPARQWSIPVGRAAARCDGQRIEDLRVRWRGPLAFLCWRGANGRRERLSLWPDTLDPAMRRELRIAMIRRDAATEPASVAG